jgi:DNA-binding beta-propeller fold protein YncE
MRASPSRLSGIAATALLAAASLALNALPGMALGATRPIGDMTTIDVGKLPTSVAVDQGTGTVWVVNSLDSTVSEISEARRAVVATIRVAASPVEIAADPKTGTVWVTCLGPFGEPAADNVVSEISEASGKVIATIKVGLVPFGIAADPRTGTVWVANTNAYSVSEISEAKRAVVASVDTGKDSAPSSVAVDPSRGVVWVSKLHHSVLEISEATRSVIAAIKVGPGATTSSLNAVAVDPVTAVAWVASDRYDGAGYLGSASAVGTASRKLLASVPVPRADRYANIADGIAADPATATVWVAENGANLVTLVSAGTDSVARNLATGDQPVAVAADPVTGTVWIVNNFDGTVTEYAYSRPEFTSSARVSLRSGSIARFGVRTSGFPVAEVSVRGKLPPGIRARVGQGTVVLAGVPAVSARGRTYRLSISADNGVGTPAGQYVVSQELVVRVT